MRSPEQGPDDDLRDFVARLAARDEWTWREFVDRFAPQMYKYYRREFGCGHDSGEDLTQECLIRIAQSIARFNYRTANQFKAWVFVIARNVGIDHTRHSPHECSLPDYLQEVATASFEPQSEAELVSAVHDALNQLPLTSRRAVELRYFHGIPAEGIAGQLNKSYGAVRVCLHRALNQIKSTLRLDDRILRRLRRK